MKISTIVPMAGAASAHTIMQAFNGHPQGSGIYMPSDDSFISDVGSDSMACNGAPVQFFRSSSDVHEIQAGSEVTGAWLHTLSSTGPDENADNKGPVTAWMKKVSDATQNPFAGPGDGWFKIAEDGYDGKWAVDRLIEADGIQKATVPRCIEDGDYLIRFEILALHSAQDYSGAQFYMECAQVRVTGGTGSESPATVPIPGVYKADDPGVLVSVWNNFGQPYPESYSIPGPRPFVCSDTSSNSPSTEETPTETETPVEQDSPDEEDVPDCSIGEENEDDNANNSGSGDNNSGNDNNNAGGSGENSAATALYGQCGGSGWTGPTACASGTCKMSNEWYSQCL